jgi:hypothetical protein
MKKYIIKNADGSEQHVMLAVHDTRKDALLTILHYATKSVEDENDDRHVEISVNYIVEAVEEEEDAYTDFVSAISYLQAKGLLHKGIRPCDFAGSINPKHFEALDALNKLFTIAQAWNTMDGFVPDFSNRGQEKWFPWFVYDKDVAGFVCADANYAPTYANATIGSRLCFKTQGRAEQFGKKFSDLYNKVFL